MFTSNKRLDQLLFTMFCTFMVLFSFGNMIGVGNLCDMARDSTESTSHEDFDFESLIKEEVKQQYKRIPSKIKWIEVEWYVEGKSGSYVGKVGLGASEIPFSGSLRKFNTGWKVSSYQEVQ